MDKAIELLWELTPGALPVILVILLAQGSGLGILPWTINADPKDSVLIILIIFLISRVCNEVRYFLIYYFNSLAVIHRCLLAVLIGPLFIFPKNCFRNSLDEAWNKTETWFESWKAPYIEKREQLLAKQLELHQIALTGKLRSFPVEERMMLSSINNKLEAMLWRGPDDKYLHHFFFQSPTLLSEIHNYTVAFHMVSRSLFSYFLCVLVLAYGYTVTADAPQKLDMLYAGILFLIIAIASAEWAETIRYNRNLMYTRMLLLLVADTATSAGAPPVWQ